MALIINVVHCMHYVDHSACSALAGVKVPIIYLMTASVC